MTLEEAVATLDNADSDSRDVANIAGWLSSVDRSDLSGALETQSEYYGYLAMLWEAARFLEGRAKAALEQTKAATFSTLTSQGKSAAAANGMLPTQTAVVEAEDTYRKAALVSGRYRGLLHALDHRRDMLVQLSARQRAELDSTPN